jgi:hypothetical protein
MGEGVAEGSSQALQLWERVAEGSELGEEVAEGSSQAL